MAIDKLLILQNVQTVLETITVANGYRTTVIDVEPVIKVWGELESHQMPWVGFGVQDTAPEPYMAGGELVCKMNLSVVAQVAEPTAAAALTTCCNLEDDIIGALMLDPARGADSNGPNAIDTKWMRTIDEVADPTIATSAFGARCMVLEFEINWRRSTARSPNP